MSIALDYVVRDAVFETMIDRERPVIEIDASSGFTEGPVWFDEGQCLIWSDIPNSRMHKWQLASGDVSIFRADSNEANGNTRDRQGRLLTCEHRSRRLTRLEHDGTITVMADRHKGRRLNSPNDVVVKSDDSIWFTDPGYGFFDHPDAQRELFHDGVYRLDARSGELTLVVSDFKRPNGLAFSPDEKTLYIADSSKEHDPAGFAHLRKFDVGADGTLSGGEIFVTTKGTPDGLRVDSSGNIWTSAGDTVAVYAATGILIGLVTGFPTNVANLAFGGPSGDLLFITAGPRVLALPVRARGVRL